MKMAAIEHDCILLAKLLIATGDKYCRTATHEMMILYKPDNEQRIYFQCMQNGYHYMLDFYIIGGYHTPIVINKAKARYPFEYMYYRYV
jgi:hypothetical protein